MADSRIKIVGVGGAGCSTVDSMLSTECAGKCELFVVNTDAASLLRTRVANKFLIGRNVTHDMSTGSSIKFGELAALSDKEKLAALVSESDVVFIVAGIGGGTGAGASPVVASLARENGSIVISFVSIPFKGEGRVCAENAVKGLENLKGFSDLIVVVQNDKAFELTESMPMQMAFTEINGILRTSIESMVEVMLHAGIDGVKPLLKGLATIGFGGGHDASEAAEKSVRNLLINRGVLNVSGIAMNILISSGFFSDKVGGAVEYMSNQFPSAQILWVSGVREGLEDNIKVISIFSGLDFSL